MSVRMGIRPVVGLLRPFFAPRQLASAQVKVAVINLQRAVFESAEIKKADAQMQATFKPRQDKIDALNKEIAALVAAVQAGNGKLTPQAEADLQSAGPAQAARPAAPHRRSPGRCHRLPQRRALQELGKDAGGREETRGREGSRPGRRRVHGPVLQRGDGHHQRRHRGLRQGVPAPK